jgi:type IV pilus assembly protein PilY1
VVRLLYQAKDAAANRQPITTPPVVSLHPNYPTKTGSFVMFGTGRFLTVSDLTDTQTQTAYGVWDTGAAVPYTRSDLQQQTTTAVTSATSGLASNILTSSSTPFTFGTLVGWYNDLPAAGQRFITNASLLNGLFVATLNIPPASACSVVPESTLLELNFKNGGAPPQVVLDVNRDGLFNSTDQYTGLNPSGIGIGQGYASPPTFLYPPGQPIRKNITLSGGTLSSIANKNTTQPNTSWLQIQ